MEKDKELVALADHPDLAVSVRSGTEHFRAGQITLTVRGDGTATVERRNAGTRSQFTAQLEPNRVAEIGRLLATHHFTAARETKLPRRPGDTPLVLDLRRGQRPLFHAELWTSDRFQAADLNAIMQWYDALVAEVVGAELSQ